MTGIVARFGADTSELDAAVTRSKKGVNDLDIDLRKGVNTAAKYGAGLAAAAAGGLTALAVQGLKAVDAQAKLARQLDGTIDGLRAVQIAANDAGVSTGVMNGAMERLGARLGEAERGSGTAKEALDRLGLSANDLAGMDTDERMAAIADRIHEMGLSGAQTSDVLRQFGIRNREIGNLMRQGGDAIRDARVEVDDLGLSMSAIDAAKIEAANDAFSRIGMQTEAFQQQLAFEVAPIMEAVSNLFVEMSKEAGGMGNMVERIMDGVVSSIGFAADAAHGFRTALAGGQVALTGLGELAVQVFSRIIEGWSMIVEQIASGAQSLVGGLNRILAPFGKEIPTELFDSIQDGAQATQRAMENSRDVARQATKDAAENFHDLAMMEMPSKQLERYVENARQAAEDAAEELANAGGGGAGGGEDDDAGGQETEAQKKRREEIAKTLESIRQANATEMQLLEEKHEEELEAMREFRAMQGEVTEEFDEMEREAKARHEAELQKLKADSEAEQTRIQEQAAKERRDALASALGDMSTLMNGNSRKMFEIGKAAALSQALIDGRAAIVGAYKVGASQGGPALGAAYATAAGAATFAQIASIRGQSFGSGGGASGSVTQSVNDNSAPVQGGGGQGGGQPQQPTTIINLSGDTFGRAQVRGLIDSINEERGDGSMMVRG